MVTRNFLNLLAMALQGGSDIGNLMGRDVNGSPKYLIGKSDFPYSVTKSGTLYADGNGISVGTGNTPASEEDFNLEATITSGISISAANPSYGIDSPGVPYVLYAVSVTNTGSGPVTVKEIGYKQFCGATRFPGSNVGSSGSVTFLLDRTVLDTPVTIAAGDVGVINYKLRTIPRPYGTVAGIPMVDFAWGTDAEIGDILDAAAAGTIDLQQDAGWRVGDMRKISLSAWTGGNSVAHAAEDLYIVITSFAEYNGCGNVMQFDFLDNVSVKQRMNSSGTTAGGYGATEMYTTTLPAMAEALPAWLKTRLKTFSVLASAGGSSLSTIETVTGNKLALRADVEIFGAEGNGQPGEGAQIEYYKAGTKKMRMKYAGSTAQTAWIWFTRSAYSDSNFCSVTAIGEASYTIANQAQGLSPFGCLGGAPVT